MVAFSAIMAMSFTAGGAESPVAWRVAAVGVLMAIWWMTEALPFAATALLPLALFPVLTDRAIDTIASAYAHPLVFLFLGGFVVAKAIERWGLHIRLADAVLRCAPRHPSGIVAALMVATACLSMWISNTATAMVMVPIAQSLVRRVRHRGQSIADRAGKDHAFAAALLLGVAFSATIGGMATLVGTPPNALLAAYLESAYGISVGFAQWMAIGLPVVLVLLPVTWFVLTRISFDLRGLHVGMPTESASGPANQRGRMSAGARLTAFVAILAALALLLRRWIADLFPGVSISDAGIAISAAVLMFVLPVPGEPGRRLLAWDDVAGLRWDVLILFGGGLALADAIDGSGLSRAIGESLSALHALPLAAVALIAMAGIVYVGELASNTAMAAVFLPIVGGLATVLGIAPVELVVPVGLAASLGFMLPVATPPNAIAYATGDVKSSDMLRAGALLDVVSILIAYGIVQLVLPVAFG